MHSYWTGGLHGTNIKFPFSHKQRLIMKYLFTNKKVIGNVYSKRQHKRNSMYIIGKILSKITRDTMMIFCRVKPYFRLFHNVTIKSFLCGPYQSLCPPVTY